MAHRNGTFSVGIVAALLAALLGCGGEDICLNCPDGTPTPTASAVVMTGNIASSTPFTTPPNINVVICLGFDPVQGVENCPRTFLTVPNVEGTFTRNNVSPGALTVFFWVDVNQNGMIDPDDPLAQLADPEGQLSDVAAGQTATLADVRIAFLEGRATASISVTQTATPTPAPTSTGAQPTPSPSST